MIDEAQAIAIAIARRAAPRRAAPRRAAGAEGWAFVEPVKCAVRKSWRGVPMRWEIRTNPGHCGASPVSSLTWHGLQFFLERWMHGNHSRNAGFASVIEIE